MFLPGSRLVADECSLAISYACAIHGTQSPAVVSLRLMGLPPVELQESTAYAIVTEGVTAVYGRLVSDRERKGRGDLLYGEMTYESLASIFDSVS